MTINIERVGNTSDRLGEGPLWAPAEGALYWVDGSDGEIWRWEAATNSDRCWVVRGRIGSIALRKNGGALVAVETGLQFFDFTTTARSSVALDQPPMMPPGYVFNDGKTDAQGRFIVGTFSPNGLSSRGALFSVNAGKCTLLDDGFVCPNGPAFSFDDRAMYLADTIPRKIFAYDYDLATGAIFNRRLFADTSPVGRPDGFTVDSDGCLWVAIVMSGKLARFTPAGKLDRVIKVPPTLPSSVVFGGDNLDVLYLTSIGNGAAFGWRCNESDGGLFAIHGLGVRGRPEPRFDS